MDTSKKPIIYAAISGVLIILLAGGLWWHEIKSRPKIVYTSDGYGGLVPQNSVKPKASSLSPAFDAYRKGDYKEAERAAQRIIQSGIKSADPVRKKEVVEARNILAFAAARQKDMKLARERFTVLKVEAAKLPDKGKQDAPPGQMPVTLEEDGAYQHAVCTAALGEKDAAYKEYLQFMKDYPESPLLNGVIQRIQRLHNGQLPEEAEKAWTQAQKVARERQKQRRLEESLCGPECLAEILRRNGDKADVESLAKEMKTDEMGTTLQSLAEAARKRGYSAVGLQVTIKGLRDQQFPLIAHMMPGHFVIVENIRFGKVKVWDPNGKGVSTPSTRAYDLSEWKTLFTGAVLVVRARR